MEGGRKKGKGRDRRPRRKRGREEGEEELTKERRLAVHLRRQGEDNQTAQQGLGQYGFDGSHL